jgi:hypothetical protein
MLKDEDQKLTKSTVISEDPVKIRKQLEETMAGSQLQSFKTSMKAVLDKRITGAIEEVLRGYDSNANQMTMIPSLKSTTPNNKNKDENSRVSRGSLGNLLNRSLDRNDSSAGLRSRIL